jgi:NAD(P)H-hydrate epimerase
MKELNKNIYIPPKETHKGQNGKLLVIGGSNEYHGAPVFSLLAARRFVDLLYFFPGNSDPHLMSAVNSIPEVITLKTVNMLPGMDCVLFGIGLGSVRISIPDIKTTKSKAGQRKLVIDGDGLKIAKKRIPEGAILTPHEREFQMLFGMDGTKENVREMAGVHKCIILKKGPLDFVSNGKELYINKTGNPGMTKGGTGDVLSGLVAALCCKNEPFEAAVAGAYINGMAGNMLLKEFGFNFCASDLIETLPTAFREFMRK